MSILIGNGVDMNSTKITNLADGVNPSDAINKDQLDHHNHIVADITDFVEGAQDSIGTILANSSNITLTYNDTTPSISADLVNTGTAGTYGSGTQIPVFTTDSKGRVTSVTNTAISNFASYLGTPTAYHIPYWNSGATGLSNEAAFTYNDSTNVLRIDGKISVGNANTTWDVTVDKDTTDTSLAAVAHSATATQRAVIALARTRGSLATPTTVVSGDLIGSVTANGYDGSSYQTTGRIDFRVDGTVSSGTVPMAYDFTTGTTEANRTARLTISSAGRVGIGTTSPSYPLHITGSTAGPYTLFIKNSSSGTGATTNIILENNTTSNQAQFFKANTGATTYKNIVANDCGLYNATTSGDIVLLNDYTSGIIKFAAGGSSTSQMVLSTAGRLGIGTTSPQRLLHVEGEVRITDLTTDSPTRIVGADADGDLGEITIGSGLTLSAGVLSSTGSYTDEAVQDAVGTILTDTNTIDFTYTDATPTITADVRTQMSITSDASGVKLSGDASSPGNSKYYGTNGSGTKGYYDLPSSQSYAYGVISTKTVTNDASGVLIDGWSLTTNSSDFALDNTDDSIKYTGSTTKNFLVNVTGTAVYTQTVVSTGVFEVQLRELVGATTKAKIIHTFQNATGTVGQKVQTPFAITAIVSLATNDKLGLYGVDANAASQSIEHKNVYMTIVSLG